MAPPRHPFKRIVLGLRPSAPDQTMRFAADLAALLDLDLLGLFLEDTRLRDFAAMPFAREFRPFGGGWRQISLDQLSHDLDLVARAAQRVFADAVKQLPTVCRFEVVRAPASEAIASISCRDDIVMVVLPVSPAERATQQFTTLIDAAFHSAAAVMIVPMQIARLRGPVVAVAATPDDPSIQAAAALAASTRERLVVVEAFDHSSPPPPAAKKRSLGYERRELPRAHLSDKGIESVLRGLNERLVVLTRGSFDDAIPLIIASRRHIPVLVVEPQSV